MAKEKMVTRTFAITNLKLMMVDITNSTVVTTEQALVGQHTADSALKWCREHNETDTLKVVTVTDLTHTEQLYGMTESEFLAAAHLLPPRKATGDTDTTADNT